MSTQMEQVVDEIVQKVRDRLLAQGLKLPDFEKEVRRHINTTATALPNSVPAEEFSMPRSADELAKTIDHTLLKADATDADVKKLCDEARKYKFATVCVNSAFVGRAAELLKGSEVKAIAVVGFPLGAATTSSKAFEAREAIKSGAQEIDMVINIGELKSRHYAFVLDDIRAVVEASRPYPVKVILETAMLDHDQKVIACALSKAADAAFVKTSTGFGPGGATTDDIALMRKIVGPSMGVKASGGIRTLDDAISMLRAGASRIGASASVGIVEAALKGISADAAGEATENKGRKPFTGLPYKAGTSSEPVKKTDKPNGSGKKSNGGY